MINMRFTHTILAATFFLAVPGIAIAAEKKAAPSSGKHDTNKPIAINSDSLEVYQQENRAVFIGHVVAVHDDVHLKADKMTVHYHQSGEKDKAKTANDGAQGGIERIDVDGNVFMSTPEETASGSTGVYQVADKVIDLRDNVVLTRGKNVLKGDHLVYNMETGKSVVTSGQNVAQPADGKTPAKKERVRALFVPDKEDKK